VRICRLHVAHKTLESRKRGKTGSAKQQEYLNFLCFQKIFFLNFLHHIIEILSEQPHEMFSLFCLYTKGHGGTSFLSMICYFMPTFHLFCLLACYIFVFSDHINLYYFIFFKKLQQIVNQSNVNYLQVISLYSTDTNEINNKISMACAPL